jgi:hypothetical protein
MKYEYKRVSNRTEKDLKQAERLVSAGWKVISTGSYTMLLEREKQPRKNLPV